MRVRPGLSFDQFRQEMDRLLEDTFSAFRAAPVAKTGRSPGYPAINVWEENHTIFVEAELPGQASDSVDVSLLNNELWIRGKGEAAPEKGAFHRRERTSNAFERSVKLPSLVNAEQVNASLVDGVLKIKLPKMESARPRKISIGSA